MNLTELFPTDSPALLERAATAFGWSVVEEADRLIESYRNAGDDRPIEHAARTARGWALHLGMDVRGDPGIRAGARLQAKWWRDVEREIEEREGA